MAAAEELDDARGARRGRAGGAAPRNLQRSQRRRGRAVTIRHLDANLRELFNRALALAGGGSQSQWISAQIRRFVREQQERFGADLFAVLTADEEIVYGVIRNGAAEIQQIAEESLLPMDHARRILEQLEKRGKVEQRRKGGKTDGARGAVVKMWFVVE